MTSNTSGLPVGTSAEKLPWSALKSDRSRPVGASLKVRVTTDSMSPRFSDASTTFRLTVGLSVSMANSDRGA